MKNIILEALIFVLIGYLLQSFMGMTFFCGVLTCTFTGIIMSLIKE